MTNKKRWGTLCLASSILLGLLAGSCRRDPETFDYQCVSPFSECIEIPPSEWIDYDYIFDSLYLENPCINPNNENEIIFVRTGKLIKYNFSTGVQEIIYTGNHATAPKWGRKDWIFINSIDGNIWKIKSNGDSLSQLTFNGANFHPYLNFAGDKFLHRDNTINAHIIRNLDGSPLDTIGNSGGDSNPDDLMAYSISSGGEIDIGFLDFSADSFHVVTSTLSETERYSIEWGKNYQSLYWSVEHGIYRTDIATGNTTQILSSCYERKFLNASGGGNLKNIYWLMVDLTLYDPSTILVKNRVCRMNTETNCFEVLEIP